MPHSAATGLALCMAAVLGCWAKLLSRIAALPSRCCTTLPLPRGPPRTTQAQCARPQPLPGRAEKVGLPFDPDLYDHLLEHG